MIKRFLKLPALAGALLLCLFAAGSAMAGETATVTVRVEGASETLLKETQVTTNTMPVYRKGKTSDVCPGTSAAGALQLATEGSWEGRWFGGSIKEGKFVGLGYSVETILGETHSLSGTSPWEFWLNYSPSEAGICSTELSSGDTLLFFPECFGECPAAPSVLSIEAPASAATGEKVTVTVFAHSHSGEASPAKAVTVEYEGRSAETNSEGKAVLEFADTGEQSVKASAGDAIRDEATVCVYSAEDEDCGDPPASGSRVGGGGVDGYTSGTTTKTTGAKASAGTTTPDAITARVTSIVAGRRYRRGHAPRLLSGHVSADSAISSVSLLLRRSHDGRCYAYEGLRERFLRARCGGGSFFKVSSGADFSYLLPAALAPGRYVLEVRATDVSGARTRLVPGSTEVVFHVG